MEESIRIFLKDFLLDEHDTKTMKSRALDLLSSPSSSDRREEGVEDSRHVKVPGVSDSVIIRTSVYDTIQAYIRSGEKIKASKAFMKATGLSLKASRDYVESFY